MDIDLSGVWIRESRECAAPTAVARGRAASASNVPVLTLDGGYVWHGQHWLLGLHVARELCECTPRLGF